MDLQKRFLMYRMYPKYLAAPHFVSTESLQEVLVDEVSNLSSTKETVLFLCFLFLQTNPSFEVRIMDDSVQC